LIYGRVNSVSRKASLLKGRQEGNTLHTQGIRAVGHGCPGSSDDVLKKEKRGLKKKNGGSMWGAGATTRATACKVFLCKKRVQDVGILIWAYVDRACQNAAIVKRTGAQNQLRRNQPYDSPG